MKTTILLAALAALTCPMLAQDNTPSAKVTNSALLADPDKSAKLSPVHVAKWTEINEALRAENERAEKAELAFFRAKEARDKAFTSGQAALVKMQAEAKCAGCIPQAGQDGSLAWLRPQPAEKK